MTPDPRWADAGAVLALALICFVGAASMPAMAGAPLSQPAYEHQAQMGLPKSAAPVWAILRKTRIGEDDQRGVFTASFPAEVRALSGKRITLSGFMLPLDAEERSRHFLLSKYTPVCFFCPPGQPNEVVEVTTEQGVEMTDRMLTVTGPLALTNNGEKGLFFRVNNATVR